MSGYLVIPEAGADLFQIWRFIARDSEEAADRVEAELHEMFDALARMPGQGHRRPDYTKSNVLFFPLYSYLIAYRPGTDPLQILAIVHGGREVRRVLKDRGV